MKHTQTSDILKYMESHKNGITSMDAFERFGATRLSSIIFGLRKRGYDIDTEMITVKTRYGKHVDVARYTLKH